MRKTDENHCIISVAITCTLSRKSNNRAVPIAIHERFNRRMATAAEPLNTLWLGKPPFREGAS